MRRLTPRAVTVFALAVIGLLAVVGPVVGSAVSTSAQAVVVSEDPVDGGAPAEPPPADPAPEPIAPEPAPSEAAPEPVVSEAAPEPVATEPEAAVSDEPTAEPSDEPTDPTDAASDEPTDTADASSDEPVDPEDVPSDEASADVMLDDELSSDAPIDEPMPIDEEVVTEEDAAGATSSIDIVDSDGLHVTAEADGLLPGSRVELWVFSTPQLVTTSTADADGYASISATLPRGLAEGEHTVLVKGTDADGQPVEFGSGMTLGPNGELLSVTANADTSGLITPSLPDNPKAPQYPQVVALDQPAAVVSTTIAAFAVISVAGATVAAAGGAARKTGTGGGVAGGGINEGLDWSEATLHDVDVEHNRGWRTKFVARGDAPGDRSGIHGAPFTSFVDEASFLLPGMVGAKSPLLARMIGDAAPIRAMLGSLSLALPIAGVVLAAVAAIAGDGIAQPPMLGLLIALIAIGVLDALAGGLAALVFAITVALMGGIIDWSSVRTLLGVALLIIGPGLVGSAFREIRRAVPKDLAGWWERGADLVIVPLLGAYTTYNITTSLPPLGGAQFPVADSATLLAWTVAGLLIVKVLLEESASRWFPERMATVSGVAEWPGSIQQVLSALVKLALFLFVSAAFIGMPWQLWAGGLIWFIPMILAPWSDRLKNSSRLWQILPASLPYLGVGLLIYLILAALLGNAYGVGTEFAIMSFFILLIPDFILGLLFLFAREPNEGDVRWYLRPTMVTVYRVGGVIVLLVTCWLAVRSIFG